MKLENAGWVNKMVKKLFTVNQAGYEISAEAELVNRDLLVNLVGGDVPHLGGIVSWDFKSRKQSEIKFASHDGRTHKDIFLAERFAKDIEDQLPGNLCVTAGIHIDGITEEQIDASFPMTDQLAKQVLAWVRTFGDDFKRPEYTTHIKNFKLKQDN